MNPITLIFRVYGDATVAEFPREVDAGNARFLKDALFTLLDDGVPSLIIDLTATGFCDCGGMRVICRVGQHAKALRTPVCVALPSTGPVRRIADLTGLTWEVRVATGLDAAHRRLHPRCEKVPAAT